MRVLDLHLESLAYKQEHLWRKEEFNSYDKNLQPSNPEPPDKNGASSRLIRGLSSFGGRSLFEEVVSSQSLKSTAKVSRNNNNNNVNRV